MPAPCSGTGPLFCHPRLRARDLVQSGGVCHQKIRIHTVLRGGKKCAHHVRHYADPETSGNDSDFRVQFIGIGLPNLPQVEKCSVNYKQKQNQRGKTSFSGDLRVSIVCDVPISAENLKIARTHTEKRVVHGRAHTLVKQLLPRLAGAAVHTIFLLSGDDAGNPLVIMSWGKHQDGDTEKSCHTEQVHTTATAVTLPQYQHTPP